MIWLAWRQSRSTCIVLLAVLLAILAGLLALHLAVASLIATTGVGHCLYAVPTPACESKATAFVQHLGPLESAQTWLNVLPALAGIFIGAPMVAREMERGTFRLAWTQGASRGRWFAAHLLVTFVLVLVFAAVVQTALWAVYQPILAAQNVLGPASLFQPLEFFDVFGVVPLAYAFFALALGLTSGALLRRTIGAMLIVAVIFVGARFGIGALRPHFMNPVTVNNVSIASPQYARLVGGGWAVNVHSHRTDLAACIPAPQGKGSICPAPLADVTYQPANRFWPFQLIESGIYLVLTMLLLAGSAMLVRWRRA